MPTIFELFGYSLSNRSIEVENLRQQAYCPFMKTTCDGGGNRYLSTISLSNSPLNTYFDTSQLTSVPSGVCSLQLQPGHTPWIICPRRLLFLGKAGHPTQVRKPQNALERQLLAWGGFQPGQQVGVWPEVKVKYSEGAKSFDYAFDYILMAMTMSASQDVSLSPYQLLGNPLILEIMTASTSGGDQRKRTTIPLAFEDAILGQPHVSPGINYRQVWARMASQLIVKSQVALGWGGKTLWLIQDTLAEYISKTTALDLAQFTAQQPSEVNILSFAYPDLQFDLANPIALALADLYAGLINPHQADNQPSFQDILLSPLQPPLEYLTKLLQRNAPSLILELAS
jgi:hypothetical protein